MTQFCIQGASTLKKSNEKRMATSFPESSVYQSKSFAKLQSATRKPFHYDSKHLFLQAYMGWFFDLHLFAFCFLFKYSLTAFYKMSLNYQCRTCWVWFLHDPYSSYFSSWIKETLAKPLDCEWTTLVYFYLVYVFLSSFFQFNLPCSSARYLIHWSYKGSQVRWSCHTRMFMVISILLYHSNWRQVKILLS